MKRIVPFLLFMGFLCFFSFAEEQKDYQLLWNTMKTAGSSEIFMTGYLMGYSDANYSNYMLYSSVFNKRSDIKIEDQYYKIWQSMRLDDDNNIGFWVNIFNNYYSDDKNKYESFNTCVQKTNLAHNKKVLKVN